MIDKDGKKNAILDLYPITKLVMILSIMIIFSLFPGYKYSYLGFLIMIFIAIASNSFGRFMKTFLKTLFILSIFIFIMRGLLTSGAEIVWQWGILKLTKEGLLEALNMVSKLFIFGGGILLFFSVTDIEDFVITLEDKGMSPEASYVVLSTFQTIPEMKKNAEAIMDAQKTRGVETEGNIILRAKAFFPTLGPLILSSIASTEEKAITLEARAFSAQCKKTRLKEIQERNVDKFIRILCYIFIFVAVIWRFLLWK